METHIAYAFESAGMHAQHEVKCIPGECTTVDFVWQHPNSVEVRIECVALREESVALREPRKTRPVSGCLRLAQQKIYMKTVDEDGRPIKFPVPNARAVHVIAADVSKVTGWNPDWWELQEIALGREAGPVGFRDNLVGLFKATNALGAGFDKDFRRSRYVRERIHAIIYLIDESSFHHPLDPSYCGHYVCNPHIPLSRYQQEALDAVAAPLNSLVTRGWL